MKRTFTTYKKKDLQWAGGWFKLVVKYFDKIQTLINEKYPDATFNIFYVKEKRGRFDTTCSGGPDELFDLAMELESESEKTCDICGKSGLLRDLPWVRTLCSEHFEEVKNKKYF